MPQPRELFLRHLAQTSEVPLMLEIVKAEGVKLIDSNGKEYIDLISGIAVSNIGHRHPDVIEAIKKQLDAYLHLMVYGEYIQTPQIQLASLLAENTPGIDSYYFVNSGSEAIEGTIKLAKRYTGRKKIISFRNAYHGSTLGALSLMSNEPLTAAYRPLLPFVEYINFNDATGLNNIDDETACVVAEIIQGEAGALSPDAEFLQLLQRRCRETGALLAVDEIQTGFGRTGSLFAFMKHSLQPDIIAMAKGMGGGMPIGAFAAPRHIMQSLSNNPSLGHITTFGGHPVCCAAAHAALLTLLQSDMIRHVERKEKLIREKLQHELILGISGEGLLLGVQFANADQNRKIIDQCIKNGVITDWFLFADDKMRIAPPLSITEKELLQACDIILKSIDEFKTE